MFKIDSFDVDTTRIIDSDFRIKGYSFDRGSDKL